VLDHAEDESELGVVEDRVWPVGDLDPAGFYKHCGTHGYASSLSQVSVIPAQESTERRRVSVPVDPGTDRPSQPETHAGTLVLA
jgi:hypothetical protein